MSKFGRNLRELRLDNSLTQDQLADKLGVSKSRISMYENGNRRPSFEMLEAISDLFNVDMNSLLGEDNPSSSSPAPAADLSEDEQQLVDTYRELNEIGKREARKRVGELTEIERYIKIRADQSAEA